MDYQNDSPSNSGGPQQTHQPTSSGQLINLVREKWPEYVIEILVIIISITISFVFDEWREKQRKTEVEQIYLKGLANDTETDRNQLVEIVEETKQILQKTNHLLIASRQSLPTDSAQNLLNAIRFIMKRPRFVSEDVTFTDLKSTGNMQLMTSPGLKRALFEYYKKVESTVLVENAELDAVTAISGPYLISRIPFVDGNQRDIRPLLNETEFRNILFLRQSHRKELLGEYQQLLKLANRIQAMVKKQIVPVNG
jgi:hypothetical protein